MVIVAMMVVVVVIAWTHANHDLRTSRRSKRCEAKQTGNTEENLLHLRHNALHIERRLLDAVTLCRMKAIFLRKCSLKSVARQESLFLTSSAFHNSSIPRHFDPMYGDTIRLHAWHIRF